MSVHEHMLLSLGSVQWVLSPKSLGKHSRNAKTRVREQCNKLRNVKISSIPKVIFERGDGKNYLLLLIF